MYKPTTPLGRDGGSRSPPIDKWTALVVNSLWHIRTSSPCYDQQTCAERIPSRPGPTLLNYMPVKTVQAHTYTSGKYLMGWLNPFHDAHLPEKIEHVVGVQTENGF